MRLRVATLNVWALPDPVGFQVPARIDAIGRHLPSLDLDVLALQEVWTAGARRRLVASGRRAGLTHVWRRPGDFRDGGLLVLSRVPIQDVRFERYTLPGQPAVADHPDYFVGKGFLHVQLAGPHGPVHLFDTHLHARYGSDVPHEYHTYRVGQIVQLALALRDTAGPTIVAGDFNLRPATSEYRILMGLTGLRDVAVELDRREPTVYDAHPLRTTLRDRRIDYVLTRDGADQALRSRSLRRAFDDVFELAGSNASFSDHAGLIAEFEIARGPGTPPPRPDVEALSLASSALGHGRSQTTRRRRRDRMAAGLGLGGAMLASAGMRDERISRRRLLRAGLYSAAGLALAPGLGFSLLSEVYAPGELEAFEHLATQLDSWPGSGGWIA
jgi:endonuclease/exonuclease/phosphatase family metal-dependent hydrolase